MYVLILSNTFHAKNKTGIENILTHLKCDYKYGNQSDIEGFDVIYSPDASLDVSKYPNKKFIFGPHFSVFPTNKLNEIHNIHKNAIYIQPSKWVTNLWKKMGAESILPIKPFPFPVDTDKFNDINKSKTKVFVYFKNRQIDELLFIETFLKNKNIQYKIFDYKKKYMEADYLSYLQESKYGIILGQHESQGFAIEEALSCNVPLLVWNTTYMSQEKGSNYPNIPCTTIPYWEDRCGDFFYQREEFEKTFDRFLEKINCYQPRQYIMEHLSVEACSNNFIKLVAFDA